MEIGHLAQSTRFSHSILILSCRLGIIKSYCDCDVANGITLLKMASAQGYVRASYALGLVLRDTHPDEAVSFMTLAAQAKYLPALQEILPARDMKALYGEPNAEELRRHLDHVCLNRLLSRHYIRSTDLRTVNTSHCWNHLCGRWAFKATPPPILTGATTTATFAPIVSPNAAAAAAAAAASSDASTSAASLTQSSSLDAATNRVSRMKMCSRCCRAKYCSKLCQVYDWRSGRHKMECQFL
jgi:MYND finger